MRSTSQQSQVNSVLAVVAATSMIVALTQFKVFFQIAGLWKPERQQVRSLELYPFDLFSHSYSWFTALFETIGNIALFVPLGASVAAVCLQHYPTWSRRRVVGVTVAGGAAVSLVMELTQFISAVGRTDIDDLWCNTVGAAIGAAVVVAVGSRWQTRIQWLIIVLAAVFFGVVGYYNW